MRLLHFNMMKPAAATLSSRISLPSKYRKQHKEGTLASYCEAVNYILEMYVMDELIAEIDTEIMPYTQSMNTTPIKYDELLWSKMLQCHRVYDEYVLKRKFMEALHKSIRHSMYSYQDHIKMQWYMLWRFITPCSRTSSMFCACQIPHAPRASRRFVKTIAARAEVGDIAGAR